MFGTVGQQVYRDGKNMWDNLVNVPLGIDRKPLFFLNSKTVLCKVRIGLLSALPIGQMKDFKLKDNYMSALLYTKGWNSGDIELMKTIQVLQNESYSSG